MTEAQTCRVLPILIHKMNFPYDTTHSYAKLILTITLEALREAGFAIVEAEDGR